MNNVLWLRDLNIVECVVSFAVLGLFFYGRHWRKFAPLTGFLAVQAISAAILIPILFFRKATGLSLPMAYDILFCTSWISAFAEALLTIGVIYHVYNEAMRPMQGLQRLGRIIFRWVAVVSVAVSLAFAAGPHNTNTTIAGIAAAIAPQLQQGVCVLTLCLLLFVCFAIRPLGLTFRSRIFGVALGLGVMTTAFLVQAAWFATSGAHSLYSPIYIVGTVGTLLAACVWGVYFLLPEPERKMILLPTTSPFFTWNRISEALGDEPGYVAVAGFKPQMLAAAELKVLSSASHKQERLGAATPPAVETRPTPALKHPLAVSQ
ncbi:MAG TPA: hypothetical protein VFA99_17835 [Acidobacteriaceae bacterium]|nr:hypothetical protein [Acidobacteriaceae bacterium]